MRIGIARAYAKSDCVFEEGPYTRERNRQRASVHGYLGGRNPSEIYLL